MPAAVYVQGAGIDEPLLRLTGATSGPAATEAAYLQDGLGSVIGTANTTGTLTANQRFDAWGNKTASSGTTPTYGYTGREPDATGLMFYRARYYHPGLGRFASRDPMGMADAVSPYAYVANNPTNLVDPMGLHSMDPILVAGNNGIQKYWGAFKQTMADVGSGLYDLLPSKQSLDEFVQSPAGQGAINGLTASGIQGDMPIAAAGNVLGNVEGQVVRSGDFSITNFANYPAGVPKPTAPVNLISGAEYQANRAAANSANRAIHRADSSISPQQIHEVQPVRFGGSPTDAGNKVYLDRSLHQQVTNWWNDLQRYIQGLGQ